MKKISTIIVLTLLLGTTAFAQFRQGTWLVGGSASAGINTNQNRNGNTTTTSGHTSFISTTPNGGYFIFDNFAIGAGINMYAAHGTSTGSDIKYDDHSASIAPFARYYYRNFYGVGSFRVGGGKTTYKGSPEIDDQSYTISGGTLGVGYAWLLTKNVALEPQAGYQVSSTRYSSTNHPITSGPYLSLGFQIYLNRQD
jgi:hypothetical protein